MFINITSTPFKVVFASSTVILFRAIFESWIGQTGREGAIKLTLYFVKKAFICKGLKVFLYYCRVKKYLRINTSTSLRKQSAYLFILSSESFC